MRKSLKRSLIVAAGNDAQLRKLCDVLEIPDVADDAAVRPKSRPHRQS
jgi:crotonobetainyl-CoA:carnitine CoA-transferase CaiB-like acyl-CoA transferase